MLLRLEPRLSDPSPAEWAARTALGLTLALLLAALVIALAGYDPQTALSALWRGAFGSLRALAATINKAVPIGLCAMGIALAYRARLWNIGAEGQLYFGAFAATGVGLALPEGGIAAACRGRGAGGRHDRGRRLGRARRPAARVSRHERDPLDPDADLCRDPLGRLSGNGPVGRPLDLLLPLFRADPGGGTPRPAGRRHPRRHPAARRGRAAAGRGRSRPALGLRAAGSRRCAARCDLWRHQPGPRRSSPG